MPDSPEPPWPWKTEDAALETDLMLALIERRKDLGKSAHEIAREMEMSSAGYQQWEAGLAYPDRFSKWRRLARLLGFTFHVELRKGGVPLKPE
mgnify:CR=1 FL=1